MKQDTRAISRSAILAKEPAAADEHRTGAVTTVAFAIATLLLCYLGTTLLLAAAA